MMINKRVTALLLAILVSAACVLPAAGPEKADAADGAVLLLGLGVHVEPFGAIPSQIVGGGKKFTGQGVRPLDYNDRALFERHAQDIKDLSAVVGKHGGKLTVQVQTPFTLTAAQVKSGLLAGLEGGGHEIALHFHEDAHLGRNCERLPAATWTSVMAEEIAAIKKAGATEVRSWSGGNLYRDVLQAGAGAGLDVYSDWKNPRDQSADPVTFALVPWKPAAGPDPSDMSAFSRSDPDGKVVFIPWGLSGSGGLFGSGKGKTEAMFQSLKDSINLSLSQARSGQVNVFHFVVHPGEITGAPASPYAELDRFLSSYVDPLVAAGRVRWATYSDMADAYYAGQPAPAASSTATTPSVAAAGYMTFAVNVHDWVNVQDSADTVLRAIGIFNKYGVKGDFYFTAPVLEAYAVKRPDVIDKLKSSGMTISYHVRPPHVLYDGFDGALQGKSDGEIYSLLRDYETYRLDLATGGLERDKPGGYSYVKQVFGSAPVAVGAPAGEPRFKDMALKVYREMGAKVAVIYHESGTDLEQPFKYVLGLLVRPSDFSITRWRNGGSAENFWWNFMSTPRAADYNPAARLKQQMKDWQGGRVPFVTSLIHENNFYRRGAESWTYYYFRDGDKDRPLQPPYNLNAADRSAARPQAEREAIWAAYEEMVAYASSNLKVVTSADIVAMASSPAPAVQPPAPVSVKPGAVERDIVYGNAGGVPLKLDIYYPQQVTGAQPAVLYVHGGAWTKGSKDMAANAPEVKELLKRGYLVASVDYRLAPQYKFPAQIEDVKCAVRYLRAQAALYGIDAGRIGATGGSAGGHLVSLLGLSRDDVFNSSGGNPNQSARVKAVADFYGPADIAVVPGGVDQGLLLQVFGASSRSDPVVKAASPVTHASAGDPPFLIVHGEKDNLVPIGQSELLLAALKGAGVTAELIRVKNAGHGLVPMGGPVTPPRIEIVSTTADFFDHYLK